MRKQGLATVASLGLTVALTFAPKAPPFTSAIASLVTGAAAFWWAYKHFVEGDRTRRRRLRFWPPAAGIVLATGLGVWWTWPSSGAPSPILQAGPFFSRIDAVLAGSEREAEILIVAASVTNDGSVASTLSDWKLFIRRPNDKFEKEAELIQYVPPSIIRLSELGVAINSSENITERTFPKAIAPGDGVRGWLIARVSSRPEPRTVYRVQFRDSHFRVYSSETNEPLPEGAKFGGFPGLSVVPLESIEPIATSDAPAPKTGLTYPDRMLLECHAGGLPKTVPPEGRLYAMALWNSMPENDGGGLTEFFGEPGTPWKLTPGLAIAYRCQLTHFQRMALVDVAMKFGVIYREVVTSPSSSSAKQSGQIVARRTFQTRISKIDEGRDGFAFYIFNLRSQFIEVVPPDTASAISMSRDVKSPQIFSVVHPSFFVSLTPIVEQATP